MRDAPLANLHRLAQETSLSASMASAKSELASLLKQVQELRLSLEPSTVIKEGPLPLTVSDLLDGDASLSLVAEEFPPPPALPPLLVNNDSGKVHKARVSGDEFHPSLWRAYCGWRFGLPQTNFSWLKEEPSEGVCCRRCWRRAAAATTEDTSDSASSSS